MYKTNTSLFTKLIKVSNNGNSRSSMSSATGLTYLDVFND